MEKMNDMTSEMWIAHECRAHRLKCTGTALTTAVLEKAVIADQIPDDP
jgi:hypothetical protein